MTALLDGRPLVEVLVKSESSAGQPMTLANMHELGVLHLIVLCLNDACRHEALLDISSYPAGTEIPSFARRMKCGKCGDWNVEVRPKWKDRQHPQACGARHKE
jgi:hypothetical protein